MDNTAVSLHDVFPTYRTSCLLCPDILLGISFSNTLNLSPFESER
jgi:hypothetical protein